MYGKTKNVYQPVYGKLWTVRRPRGTKAVITSYMDRLEQANGQMYRYNFQLYKNNIVRQTAVREHCSPQTLKCSALKHQTSQTLTVYVTKEEKDLGGRAHSHYRQHHDFPDHVGNLNCQKRLETNPATALWENDTNAFQRQSGVKARTPTSQNTPAISLSLAAEHRNDPAAAEPHHSKSAKLRCLHKSAPQNSKF